MNIKHFVVSRNVTVEMGFNEMREKFVAAGQCQMWNWDKLYEALEAGFTVVMPLGIEVSRA